MTREWSSDDHHGPAHDLPNIHQEDRRIQANQLPVNPPHVAPYTGPVNPAVHHPEHYGGGHNVYEAIKVIEAWKLNFNLGNAVKYIARANHKGQKTQDLQKAVWYIEREIKNESTLPQQEVSSSISGKVPPGYRQG